MAWMVLHPFLEPAASGQPPIVLPPATPFAAAPDGVASTVATVTAGAAALAPAAGLEQPSSPPVMAHAKSPEELRADIEAAIAARKAAMMRHSCAGCGATVDAGDAFCRSCGTRVKE
jgi:hypothetical protein